MEQFSQEHLMIFADTCGVFSETFDDFENSQMKVSDFSEVTKIFPTLAQNFLKILHMNPHNFSAKHVNLQTWSDISV